ncbi:MAG: hypothetical protein CVV11_07805 [Gammaproteobacteria bacterium HGW-Gammaproteobacteria-15]|nr:MAG: hypothetical protein CVV11_07805 [Gammaproteobacteria bacterium HGW-Gammaproteobacteria-15]
MESFFKSLAWFIKAIRPKTYNVIARSLVWFGLMLMVESHFGIVQTLMLAGYESFFGTSEILRNYVASNSNPWVGFLVVVLGLVYHILMTVGKELSDLWLSKVPKKPILSLTLINSDMESFKNNSIFLRGHIVETPSEEDIPENKVNLNFPHMQAIASVMNDYGNSRRNTKLYRERAEFLRVWGGSELILLNLSNISTVLAAGVKVVLTIPRIKGVSADNTLNALPSLPSENVENKFGSISSLLDTRPKHYDLKNNHSNKEYCFEWASNNIQANTEILANTYIYLRTEVDINLTVTIYCDQFDSPITETYQVVKANKHITVVNSQLTSTSQGFFEIADKCVMNGYLSRSYKIKLDEIEHRQQEILPPN